MLMGDPVAVVYAFKGNAAFKRGEWGVRGVDKTRRFADMHAPLQCFFIRNIILCNKARQGCDPRTSDCVYLRHASIIPNLGTSSTQTAPMTHQATGQE